MQHERYSHKYYNPRELWGSIQYSYDQDAKNFWRAQERSFMGSVFCLVMGLIIVPALLKAFLIIYVGGY